MRAVEERKVHGTHKNEKQTDNRDGPAEVFTFSASHMKEIVSKLSGIYLNFHPWKSYKRLQILIKKIQNITIIGLLIIYKIF